MRERPSATDSAAAAAAALAFRAPATVPASAVVFLPEHREGDGGLRGGRRDLAFLVRDQLDEGSHGLDHEGAVSVYLNDVANRIT